MTFMHYLQKIETARHEGWVKKNEKGKGKEFIQKQSHPRRFAFSEF